MSHTKLPWHYERCGNTKDTNGMEIIMSGKEYIVSTWAGSRPHDAAFIVKACNEYYPLTRVVKALVEKLDADVWFLETAENEGICVESIKQIIKQAEAE